MCIRDSILDGRAEEKKTSAFTFSQEIIDAVLANGSGFSEGKMRIYEQFEKSLSTKENADFLKNEYGWGGSYPVIIGAGIDESHDGKGITITKGIGKEKPHITLSWSQVEKRIGELIRICLLYTSIAHRRRPAGRFNDLSWLAGYRRLGYHACNETHRCNQ